MGNPYKDFKTDSKVEREGIWLDYGSYQIRIARAGGANKLYERTLENKTRPYRRAIQNEQMPADRQEEILMEVYVDSVIIDWKDVCDENDQPLEFTRENVLKLFKDIPDLWRDILQQSTKAGLFRKDIQEAEAKN